MEITLSFLSSNSSNSSGHNYFWKDFLIPFKNLGNICSIVVVVVMKKLVRQWHRLLKLYSFCGPEEESQWNSSKNF
ncbi:hypothetical protein H8356DRAFT_1347973 [Neocallimastix lanati (nom. inval.)]|nr:hypothetical protein H8356DRAFT_1347973 [Neocallimastix sp. JGI-2020a]